MALRCSLEGEMFYTLTTLLHALLPWCLCIFWQKGWGKTSVSQWAFTLWVFSATMQLFCSLTFNSWCLEMKFPFTLRLLTKVSLRLASVKCLLLLDLAIYKGRLLTSIQLHIHPLLFLKDATSGSWYTWKLCREGQQRESISTVTHMRIFTTSLKPNKTRKQKVFTVQKTVPEHLKGQHY